MAIGDVVNFVKRLKGEWPSNWFPQVAPRLDSMLTGFSTQHSFIYSLMQYIKLQVRLQTATEENLDLISCDYFGGNWPRNPGESDNAFRQRIAALLFCPKVTRQAMIDIFVKLTGIAPRIYEPGLFENCGAYNIVQTLGYNTYGAYGSGNLAYQFWIDVFVPAGSGMSNYSGYNTTLFGYNVTTGNNRGWYGSQSLVNFTLTDAQIEFVVNYVKPSGTKAWLTIYRGVE